MLHAHLHEIFQFKDRDLMRSRASQQPYFLEAAIGVSRAGRSLAGNRAEEGTVQAVRLAMSTRDEVKKVDAGRYSKDHVLRHLNTTRLV